MKKKNRIVDRYAYLPTRIYFTKDKEYGFIWLCSYKAEESYSEEDFAHFDPNFGSSIFMNTDEKIMIKIWKTVKKFK
jgi:hypothetical protein